MTTMRNAKMKALCFMLDEQLFITPASQFCYAGQEVPEKEGGR
jgi:hypothetical protein